MLGAFASPPASAVSYYVSFSTGSDTTGNGNIGSPWKTLGKISALALVAGDQVLLKSGDTWTGETLTLHGNGTATTPITITSYGAGNKPIVSPGASIMYAIIQDDYHGYKYTNLEISNTRLGIRLYNHTTFGHDYLWVENCYFHDLTDSNNTSTPDPLDAWAVYSAGVIVRGDDPGQTGNTVYSNITITNCTFLKTDCSINIGLVGAKPINNDAFINVNLTNLTCTQNYRTGALIITSVSGGKVDNCVIDQTGYLKGMYWGVAAIQLTNCTGYQVLNSELKNTLTPNGSPDGDGVDFEDANSNVIVDNCYIHDNAGPGFMLFGDNASWLSSANNSCVVTNCILERNNSSLYTGNISWMLGSGNTSCLVTNNTIRLQNTSQSYLSPDSTKTVFAADNQVYNTTGARVYGPTPLVSEDFNSDTTGQAPAGWTVGDPTLVTVQNVPSSTDKSMFINNSSAYVGNLGATKSFVSQTTGSVIAQFKFRINNTNTSVSLGYIQNSAGTDAVNVFYDGGLGKIRYVTNGNVYNDLPGGTITANVWYDMKLIVSKTANTYSIYYVDLIAPKVTGATFRNSVTDISQILFRVNDVAGSNVSAYFDGLNVTTDQSIPTVLLADDFNSGTAGSVPSGWAVGDPTLVTVQNVPSTTDKSMLINNSSSFVGNLAATKTFTAQASGALDVDFKFRINQTNASVSLGYIQDSAGTDAVSVFYDGGLGKILYVTSGNVYHDLPGGTITVNTWYEMNIVVNKSSNTYDIYFVDLLTPKVTGATFRNSVSNASQILFRVNDIVGANVSAYFDNISVVK